jgi:NADPH:quinone reductase-like Zn-dependent oxidoreductase
MSLQRVTRSTIIDAPIEQVWAVLRDFNSHRDWHPVIAASEIEGGEASDQVGCVRNFTLKDGNHLREQLLTLDDRNYVSTYCILDATIPLQRYVATVRLARVTDSDRTFWHWQSTFATPRGRERELAETVGTGVYEAGFAALRAYLAQRARGAPTSPRSATSGATVEGAAIVLAGQGGPEQLRVTTLRAASPGPGEARLRQSAIGLNFIDVYVRIGLYAGLVEPGGVPGFEAAGTVLDVGAGVTHVAPGDRVAYACPPAGAYAAVRTMKAEQLVKLPDHVSEEQAAALLLKGCTVEYCLFRLHRLAAGETVLVHAAAGGLGMLVAQWARALGARVLGTVGSESKAHLARAWCDQVFVVRDGGFAAAVLDATEGRGVQLIVDGLGEPAREDNLRALAALGHWISVGQAGGASAPLDPVALGKKSATYSRPVVFDYLADAQRRRAMSERVFEALRDGSVRPQIARYPLTAAPQAHADLQERRTVGQVVLLA